MNDSIQTNSRILPRILAGVITVISALILLTALGAVADLLKMPTNDFTTTIFSGGVLVAASLTYRHILTKLS